jgi:hypothetical protein
LTVLVRVIVLIALLAFVWFVVVPFVDRHLGDAARHGIAP